jgi:hypothetical protein
MERIGRVAAMEDDLMALEGPSTRDREQSAQCILGHVGEQLPLHECDEFDTSCVAPVNDSALRAS